MELCDIPKKYGFRPGFTDTEEEKKYNLDRCARLFPYAIDGEGHFVALLKKTSERKDDRDISIFGDIYEKGDRISVETGDFLAKIKRDFKPERLRVSSGKVYYLPERSFFGNIGNICICRHFLWYVHSPQFFPQQLVR